MPMHEYQKQMYKKVGVIVALIVLPVAGFFAGMQYQKQTTPAAATNSSKFGNGPRMMRNRAVGTVKSIDSGSITVTDRLSSTDKTYTLTSSTTYKNGTSDAQASDVKVGDTVMLTLDSSDSTKVTTVTVNPQLMFRGSDDGSQPSTTDSGSGDAILQ
jgi:hypothetical protein